MLSEEVALDLSPDPILEAVEGYRGAFLDLDHGRRVDAAAFHRGRRALELQLPLLGLCPGDRVVFAVSNGPGFAVALAAILKCGGSPIFSHALTPAAELRRTALRFGALFIVNDGPSSDELEAVCLSTASVSEAEWLRLAWSCIDAADRGFADCYPALAAVPLHQTSGTTGVPKIAARPGRAAVEEARHYIETTGIDDRDVVVVVSPMSHAYAFGMGFMTPMLSGADVAHMREYSPKLLFDAFSHAGVTVFPAVPAMLEVLLFGAGDRLRHSPRTVFAAGAPLPERVARNYREQSGAIVRPLYGTTETGGISIATVDRDGLTTGCVGSPMQGVEVEVRETIADARADGAALETLFVRSSSMMAGYLGPGGLDRSSLEEGWFQTGDLAQLDVYGSIHLRGRITEVINVGGMKVVPSEVEEVIAGIDGVREAKVYAGNSRSGSQFVKAAVVSDGSVTDAVIREHCARELIYYKRPSAVLLVESLPKTPSGKVILSELP